MSANYPTADPSFSVKSPGQQVQSAHIDALQDEVVAIGAALRGTLLHDLTLTTGKVIKERGRSVAMGEWTAVTFSAGNFTANGAMTWTVAVGDQTAFAYTLVGKTMTVAFYLTNTTVGGTPNIKLQIAIPNSKVAANYAVNPVRIRDNGTSAIGFAQVATSGTVIEIYRMDVSNWSAATDATDVWGQLTFEVTA